MSLFSNFLKNLFFVSYAHLVYVKNKFKKKKKLKNTCKEAIT